MSEQEQNTIPENLDDNSCSASQWEAMKKELLSAVDDKFDVEAVAQMVEQLDFSKKLNGSLQQSFQSLQAELQRKDQMIQYLQGRLDNLELDIALLKRTVVSPHPFPLPSPAVQPQKGMIEFRQMSIPTQSNANMAGVRPPDFSKLREMTVAEPVNKFVPPPKTEAESEAT